MRTNRRSKKLILPSLQLRLVLVFLGTACVSVLAQAITLNRSLQHLFTKLPGQEALLLEEWPALLRSNLLWTFALLVPLMFAIGIMVTFRIAGPLHRFETYLRQLAAGQNPGACRIREKDHLHDLCDLLNTVTADMRMKVGTAPTRNTERDEAA